MVKKYRNNERLSEHFEVREFRCPESDSTLISEELIAKLEKFFDYGITSIVITSGYRTPEYSVLVKGHKNDAHTKGLACDCVMYKEGIIVPTKYTSCLAQLIGFSGIGIIDPLSIHLDVRTAKNYNGNAHWWGDEQTGNNNIVDFFEYSKITKPILFGYLEYYKEECYLIKAKKKTSIRFKPKAIGKIKKYYPKGKKAWIHAQKGNWGKVKSGWIYLPNTTKI